jgi:hypothetical protein
MRVTRIPLAIAGVTALGVSALVIPAASAESPTLAAATVTAPSAAKGPTVKWDWTMPTFMKDKKTWVSENNPASPNYIAGGYFVPGPDGIPDKEMEEVPWYDVAGGALYGKLPEDNKFKVRLDAQASSGKGDLRCSWRIEADSVVNRKNKDCGKKVSVYLPEGKHRLTLTVKGDSGTTIVDSKVIVKNSLIAVMGDSYSSGEGFPPFLTANTASSGGARMIDWDQQGCHRSRFSGFVRAAQTVESADKRSNVTLVDVACSGAEVSQGDISVSGKPRKAGGILYPQQMYATPTGQDQGYVPAQADQLRAINGNDPYDTVLMSDGGNDVGFSLISKACLVEGQNKNCYSEAPYWDDLKRPLYEAVDYLLDRLVERFKRMAPCLSGQGGSNKCKTYKLENGVPATKESKSKPVILDKTKDMVQASYPDLTSTTDSAGNIIPCNALSGESPMNQISNSWGWGVVYTGETGKPYTLPTNYSQLPTPDPAAITPTAPGMVNQFRDQKKLYGFSKALSITKKSRGHGLCAGANSWLYGIVSSITRQNPANGTGAEHPNERGQVAYEQMLAPKAKNLNNVPVSRPSSTVRPDGGLG